MNANDAKSSENIERQFTELRTRLRTLEKRLNPKDEDLHFVPRLVGLKREDFSELLAIAEDGLSKVREHEEYFLTSALYDDGMFWYELFTLISTASLQPHEQKRSRNQSCGGWLKCSWRLASSRRRVAAGTSRRVTTKRSGIFFVAFRLPYSGRWRGTTRDNRGRWLGSSEKRLVQRSR